MYSTSELDELFQILNSVKGFKLNNHKGATQQKHINHGLEWDELTPMVTACYNFFPNCSARESAFFIMFWRDKLNMMLHAARRYFHDDNSLPNLEALKNIYQVVTQQLLNSRERYIKKCHSQQPSEPQLQADDLILIKNHTAKSFKPKYKGNYRIVKIHGNNTEIWDFKGNINGTCYRCEEDNTDRTGCR